MKTTRSAAASERTAALSFLCGPGAFTRVELVVVFCVLALIGITVLPALASPRQRSQRVQCANNLRQIFVAAQLWGHDHGDRVPWEVPLSAGGTQSHPLGSNPWLHFSWMSNELASPVLLLCPSDSGQPARDFSGDPAGGYLHPNFANRATSYFLAHSSLGLPTGMMTGDRGLYYDGLVSSCANFTTTYRFVHPANFSPLFGWDTNLHDRAGNILRLDGRVGQFSNAELRADVVSRPPDDNGMIDFILPR